MTSTLVRGISLAVATVVCHPGVVPAQGKVAAWVEESTPAPWNTPGASVPAAPTIQGAVNPRCREQAASSGADISFRR